MFHPLIERWRSDAQALRRCHCVGQAELIERLIRDVQDFLELAGDRELTLTEASDLSGYSVAHLSRLVREGKIANAGRPGAPRIAYGQLPKKVVAATPGQDHIGHKQIVRLAITQE